jgi:type VI secretion system protein ImpK
MTVDDDPFGLQDEEHTQVARLRPGGRDLARPTTLPPPRGAPPRSEPRTAPRPGAVLPAGTPGRGPLVEAGFGLLALAPLLRSRTPPGDPAALRVQIERELARFMDVLRKKGIEERLVGIGHYCLCALLDDVVLNTPWGAHSAWRSSSLVGTLHHDVAAGEHFFDYLDKATRAPDRNRPVLELMASCLALGFEGRYRLMPGGSATLQQQRVDLASLLSRLEPEGSADLSGHWQGVPAAYRPLAWRIPLWVFASALLALLLVVYTTLAVRLGYQGDRVDALAAGLPPGPVVIDRAVAFSPPSLAVGQPLAPPLRACFGAAQTATIVTEDSDKVLVRLPDAGLFASGGADLEPTMAQAMHCVAGTLLRFPGKVMILGHTDNVPIHTARFPNNWALSKARAEAVASIFRTVIPDGTRLVVEGRGDTEPVASNADAAGRARNRRVDIVLLK